MSLASLSWATAMLIAAGVALGCVRVLLRSKDSRRALGLAALMAASGTLLWLALYPPRLPVGGETLLVATVDAPRDLAAGAGERLVALPEAPPLPAAERVPDLATALRRYPRVTRLRIAGRSLPPRDRDAAPDMPVAYRLPPPRHGLIALDPPAPVAAGAVFTLAGRAAGLTGGSVELSDPTGRRVDARRLGGDGSFTLGGIARAAGSATFTLRVRNARGGVVEEAAVPLWTRADRPVRALLIGAPSPENKYLRRWAIDAGLALTSRLDAGGGVALGDTPAVAGPIDPARFDPARFDLAIVDDRSLLLRPDLRVQLARGVAGGLGLAIRMTGPADAAGAGQWRALGLPVAGGARATPVLLPPRAEEASVADAADVDLTRWDVAFGSGTVPAVIDAAGTPLAGWRARGQGRVGLWTLADGYALVLAGRGDLYAQYWSTLVGALARATPVFAPRLDPLPQVGARMGVCGIGPTARVVTPTGGAVPLLLDPVSAGCAAYRPAAAGFHTLIATGAAGAARHPFFVQPAAALPALRDAQDATATARWAGGAGALAARAPGERRGPAWPWLLGWLAVSALLWWGERRPRV